MGKIIKGRQMRPLKEKCRLQCATKLNEDRRAEIFEEYWGLNDFDKRVAYIANHVIVKEKKVARGSQVKNRTCTLQYELEQNNRRVIVCKPCFLATLDENDGFTSRALANKRESYSGVTRSDKRGKMPSAKKTPQPVIDKIHEHIASFPKYKSHYARSRTDKEYLGSDLSVSQMFKLYQERGYPKTSLSVYFREFQKTGLKFKPPPLDTCNKCDAFNQSLKQCKTNDEKEAVIKERDVHQKKAQDAYDAKKADKLQSKMDNTKQVITFDLEQVLPCPQLSSGETFYKRQLSIYNLTVYNCSTKIGTNYMWSEVVAGRGANEIASCITRYIKEEIAEPVTHLTMYSDSCSGQNKNSHIHAQIEKKKRKATVELHHPHDWYNFIRSVPYNNASLLVREMHQKHFRDFASLLQVKKDGPLVMRDKNTDGDLFRFAPVRWFQFRKECPTTVHYKTDLLPSDLPCLKLNFRRRGKIGNKSLAPKRCYNNQLPISLAKKNDLIALLPQINPVRPLGYTITATRIFFDYRRAIA
ncbi:Serine--pyruvate aminotransferase, mitochondrial [Frankliniella fusca]|uniref:Serine--pyruvate aminotransferase, mitochondrial n=1 Tax=Frankliniella fusca TaxID=407009 RepID=A0AAE1HSE2_9NEOP|nr:Serine--pyruvate aminotransferase, mitochondrial [Frankliniella fusca]